MNQSYVLTLALALTVAVAAPLQAIAESASSETSVDTQTSEATSSTNVTTESQTEMTNPKNTMSKSVKVSAKTDKPGKALGKKQDVVETAMSAGQFTTLTKALQSAGLVDDLKNAKSITVFAPTDEAFSKLPAGTLDELMKPENKQKLVDILQYHVATQKEKSNTLKNNESLQTLEGKPLTVHVSDSVMVNDATVQQADIEASNGVIHVIDKVLMPE